MFGLSLTDLMWITIIVLGVIAAGKLFEGIIKVLVASLGTILVVYAAGVIAMLAVNFLMGMPVLADIFLSWIAVFERALEVIC